MPIDALGAKQVVSTARLAVFEGTRGLAYSPRRSGSFRPLQGVLVTLCDTGTLVYRQVLAVCTRHACCSSSARFAVRNCGAGFTGAPRNAEAIFVKTFVARIHARCFIGRQVLATAAGNAAIPDSTASVATVHGT